MNQGESRIDLSILIGSLGLAIGACFLLSSFWGFFCVSFVMALGVWELISVIRSKRTLTQRFRQVMKDNPLKAWIAIVALDLFFIYLNFHLLMH